MALKMGVKVGNVDVDVGSMVKLGNELVTKARQGGCLGLYIEENFIKYAKILKERDNIKVETFGTKFYDNLDQAISQIINETGSQKTPIAVNLPGGYFDYLELFALLNNSAMKKSVDIEFEMLCQEKGINKDDMEKRYIFMLDQDDADKMKVLNVSISKDELGDVKDRFNGYNLTTIEPLQVDITNLIYTNEEQNELIVNLEKETTLTFLQHGKIDKIDTIDTSIMEAFNKIMDIENSREKAYEILKNTTITSQDISVSDGNEYLDTVVPVLFKILNELKEKMNEYGKQINKVYFSGTGIVINNLDMYFQDRFNDIQCDLIKPTFIDSQSLKIGIKDYIEVNSAISMALAGAGVGTGELNFCSKSLSSTLGKLDFSSSPLKMKGLKDTAGERLDAFEKMAVRIAVLSIIFIFIYAALSKTVMTDMNQRNKQAKDKLLETQKSIEYLAKDKTSIEYLRSEYQTLISRLNNEQIINGQKTFRDDEIPNFLTSIGSRIPTEVKLVRIENTQGRHFVIEARAIKYQQLGYFKSILQVANILTDVKATTGVRYHDEDVGEDYVLITIEGDLAQI